MSTELRAPEAPPDGLAPLSSVPDVAAALARVNDPRVDIRERGMLYVLLRELRLQIDRAIRPVTGELEREMAKVGARQWGPLVLRSRAVDPVYVCNQPGNWGDSSVQDALRLWQATGRYTAPDGTEWIRSIIAHREVDSAALGAAVANGDPRARELWDLLTTAKFRTEAGRASYLTVQERGR